MLKQFEKFLVGPDNLNIFSGDHLIFRANQDGIAGMLDYVNQYGQTKKNLTIFDTKIGRAIALLCVYAGVKNVFAKVGSLSAKRIFKKFGIKFYFKKTIPAMINKNGDGICPMEKLSRWKSPIKFYECLKK